MKFSHYGLWNYQSSGFGLNPSSLFSSVISLAFSFMRSDWNKSSVFERRSFRLFVLHVSFSQHHLRSQLWTQTLPSITLPDDPQAVLTHGVLKWAGRRPTILSDHSRTFEEMLLFLRHNCLILPDGWRKEREKGLWNVYPRKADRKQKRRRNEPEFEELRESKIHVFNLFFCSIFLIMEEICKNIEIKLN